jgi:hypothetical protein
MKTGLNFDLLDKAVGSKAVARYVVQVVEAGMELRVNLIREETRNAMLGHQASGRRMSHLLPYGWAADPDDDRRMIPNPYEQKVIKRIISLKEQGLSLRAICRKLHEEGIKARQKRKKVDGEYRYVDGKWAHTLIRKILARAEADQKL